MRLFSFNILDKHTYTQKDAGGNISVSHRGDTGVTHRTVPGVPLVPDAAVV